MARVVAIDDEPPLHGSVRFLVEDDELIEPLEQWHADER